ncbi:MAG: hypothetical protein IKI78_04720, partial [Clostridia bacterium]|nr:hypothetical protein [Clostridia bacterium]
MVKDYLKITEDVDEIVAIAHRLVDDVNAIKRIYTPLMFEKMREEIAHYTGGKLSEEETERTMYRCIYDFWVYGCTVDEEFYLGLLDKTDAEKREYMVHNIRSMYVRKLNYDAGPDRVEKLEDKYRLYKTLEPYYKRDVIEI